MAYQDRFLATDNLVLHLSPIVSALTDTAIQANYAGFLSVSAVTVYELAIKDIFIEFAKKKHLVFGNFTQNHFSQINGRIKLSDLKGLHIEPFGDKYLDKFEKKVKTQEKIIFNASRKNLRSDYSNLILCRHKYVHAGYPTLSFQEVIESYQVGKNIIHCLHEAMQK